MKKQFKVVAALSVLTAMAFPAHAQTPAAPSAPRQTPPASAGEVTVTGTRPGVTTSIDSRAYLMDRDLGASTGTLADALRNVPSVEVDLDGNVSLRGDQGVQIFVDGKPSPLFVGPGRAQAMQSFAAKDIERIEVMTTPSAAYSPDGAGGIINLITKQPNRPMTTASVSAQYGGAAGTRFSGNYTRKAGRLSITASASRNDDVQRQERVVTRVVQPNPATAPLQSVQTSGGKLKQPVTSGNLNVTYDATPKLQLGASAFVGAVSAEGFLDTGYDAVRSGAPVSIYDAFATAPNVGVTFTGFGGTATRKLNEQEHDLSAAYNFSRTAQFVPIQTVFTPRFPAGPLRFEETLNGAVTRQNKLRVNYRAPLPKAGKYALGFEIQDDDNIYDNSAARGPSLASLALDPNVSNKFAFEQHIGALFGTIERPFGPLSAQLGLRVEQTDLTIAGVDRAYARAYPTLNLSYKLTDQHSLRGGYSRRVQRPSPTQLNPFRSQNQADAQTVTQGNPDLQPQETDSFELGYQYRQGQTSYLATLYWRKADGEFTPVNRDIGGGVTLTRPENLGSSNSVGLELVASGRLTSALKYNLSTNTFWKEIDAGNLGIAGTRSAVGVSGNANLNWDATAKDAIQVNAIATGKRLTAQGYAVPYWTLNFGWRHKLNDRLSTTLTLRDVLDATRYKTVIDTPTLQSIDVNRQRLTRAAWFQINYTFSGTPRSADPTFDYGGGGGGGLGN